MLGSWSRQAACQPQVAWTQYPGRSATRQHLPGGDCPAWRAGVIWQEVNMAWVQGIGRAAPTLPGLSRPAVRGAAFKVPTGRPEAATATGAAAEVSLGGMLALQEAESGAVRDREARRRGQELLAALVRLQRALLDGRRDLAAFAAAWRTLARRHSRRGRSCAAPGGGGGGLAGAGGAGSSRELSRGLTCLIIPDRPCPLGWPARVVISRATNAGLLCPDPTPPA